jgi:hypothetical protein
VIDEIHGDLVPENQKLIGGWAHLVRSDRLIPYHRRLNVNAYRPPYENKFWRENPAGQIVKCAEADCMRSAYPTLVGGLYPEGDNGFSIVTRDAAAVPSLMAPPKNGLQAPQRRELSPVPSVMQPPNTRKGPTLVEQPLSDDEKAEADAGYAPAQNNLQGGPTGTTAGSAGASADSASAAASGPQLTPTQKQLAEIVLGVGSNFDAFRVWAAEQYGSGTEALGVLAWDTYDSFADVPEKVAKLCVRAKTQLVAEIQKEGV